MLSIIISSYQDFYLKNLKKNISKTIGNDIVYELIVIENYNEFSIAEVYNKGAKLSNYNVLLFLHEDVIFKTLNWGEVLLSYFDNKNRGVVGLAGNNYLPNVPLGWSGLYESSFINLIQSSKDAKEYKDYSIDFDIESISLDGVFLACTKKVHMKYKFEENIQGFHCYDFIFSNRVSNDYNNIITSKIKIIHFSKGNRDINWINSLISSRKYYIPNNKKNNIKLENKAYYYYGSRLITYNFSFKIIFKEINKYLDISKLGFVGFTIYCLLLIKYIIYKLNKCHS